MTFQALGLCPPILSALADMDYKTPSPIQEKAIPPALAGRDVLGCAQTGTGKTCAFATPILQRLNENPVKGHPIRALILTPTRELALQIQENIVAYGKNLPLRSAVIFGGVGQQPQVDKLKAGVDILVATPGRLQDLRDQGYIHVERLEVFVLDEADRMLDMGFIHDVKKILKWLPQKKQTLFFSATMPPEVQGLVDSLLTDPVKVAVNPVSSPVEVIDQKLYFVDRGNKSKLLARLILTPEVKNALVFTRTKHGANKVARDLEKSGVTSAAIHGNKSQTARQQALADFKAGRIKALVATDIAARGIDIEELSHVFNYNLPDVPETYVHRIGRTGRAGHGGVAVSFCEFGEKPMLKDIEKLLKKPVPVVEDHPWPMAVFEAPKKDAKGREINPDDAEARAAARERKRQRQEAQKAAIAAKEAKAAKKAEQTVKKTEQVTKQPAQTPAAGKRQAAGYKPSRTIEEAIAAIEPNYTPAERAAQTRYYRDPLAGDTVMDATARLLAPRKPVYAPPVEEPPARETSRQEGKNRRKKKRSSQGGKRQDGSQQQEAVRQEKPFRPKQAQPRKEAKPQQPSRPKDGGQGDRRRQNDRRKGGQGRRGGPMETTLRPGSQRDSTEQRGSLMKPYYFNPDED